MNQRHGLLCTYARRVQTKCQSISIVRFQVLNEGPGRGDDESSPIDGTSFFPEELLMIDDYKEKRW